MGSQLREDPNVLRDLEEMFPGLSWEEALQHQVYIVPNFPRISFMFAGYVHGHGHQPSVSHKVRVWGVGWGEVADRPYPYPLKGVGSTQLIQTPR